LLTGFDLLSGRLSEKEADAFADRLFKALHELRHEEDGPRVWEESSALTKALSALGARLSNAKVAEVSGRLIKAIGKQDDKAGPAHLIAQVFGAQALAPAGVPLGPMAQVLAASNVATLDGFTLDNKDVGQQVELLRALAPRLSPAMADEAMDVLWPQPGEAFEAPWRPSIRSYGFALMMVALAPRVSPAKVGRAAEAVLSALPSDRWSRGSNVDPLIKALKGLAERLDQKEARRLHAAATRRLVGALGMRADPLDPEAKYQDYFDYELLRARRRPRSLPSASPRPAPRCSISTGILA
jgi:hypothetical protein